MKSPNLILTSAVATIVFLIAGGCGYSTGSLNKTGINKIFIPTFQSQVMEPNLGALVTGTVVKNFQRDGTIQMVEKEDAEAVLYGSIVKFELNPARFRVEDERSVREYHLLMRVDYTLHRKGEERAYASGHVDGQTSFFIGDDLANDKRQGVSYVAEEIGRELVYRVAESW